ncbi:hypothetical protein B296_00058413 [Ensete ventricosum]|uniref:Uncharacterized protein n=1 Tax=Ensete ventricosum TaxID=4639 RepID=A0A426XIN6_ENSVE|nr:hypothetical protein B296_00058413 [Ensete ventricosum]
MAPHGDLLRLGRVVRLRAVLRIRVARRASGPCVIVRSQSSRTEWRWSTVGCKELLGPTRQVGCGCVGTRVGSLRLQLGSAGDSYRKGRVEWGSRRDPFDD